MAANMIDGNGRSGNRLRMAVWGIAACLLLLPAVAMQFTSEVKWTALDFFTMGVMLGTACGIYELGVRMSRNSAYRAGMGLAALGGFLLVWINVAVGIIGSEQNPENLVFAGVLAIGVVAALVAHFRAAGMARALAAMAIAQALVALVAPFKWPGQHEVWILSAIFTALWLASAALFRRAASPA